MPRAHVVKAEGRGGAVQSVKSSGFNNLIPQTIIPVENPKTNPFCPRQISDADRKICFRLLSFQWLMRSVLNGMASD
jgi:hypothetical protein